MPNVSGSPNSDLNWQTRQGANFSFVSMLTAQQDLTATILGSYIMTAHIFIFSLIIVQIIANFEYSWTVIFFTYPSFLDSLSDAFYCTLLALTLTLLLDISRIFNQSWVLTFMYRSLYKMTIPSWDSFSLKCDSLVVDIEAVHINRNI